MKLFLAGPSPFVRKVLITLHETNQIAEVELVKVAASPLAPDPVLTAANPVGKIPCLQPSDGAPALYDSRVICRYLDDRAGAGLYPSDRLYEVLTLEALADAMLDAAVLMVYEARFRPAELVFTDWVEGQWGKVARGLDALEAQVPALSGPLDMAQIAVASALAYLDFRHPTRDWRATRPALAAWFATFETRPSMVATQPEG